MRHLLVLTLCTPLWACVGRVFDPPAAAEDAGLESRDAGASGGGSAGGGSAGGGSAGGGSAGGGSAGGGSAGGGSAGGGGGASIAIGITPRSASVSPGEPQQFTCTVTGTTNTACRWSVQESDGGTIDVNTGTYLAPALGGVFHVIATSVADPSMTAIATIGVVAPCSSLSGSVGVWQNISPPEFSIPNAEAYTVAVDPVDGTLYATAGNVTNPCPPGQTCSAYSSGILKSTDCGAHWSRVNEQTANSDGAMLSTGAVWALLVDQVSPNIVYAVVGYGSGQTIHKSVDHGVHWVSLQPDPLHRVDGTFLQAITIDPNDHQHLAATFHSGCGPAGGPYTWCFSTSTNGGADWTVFDGPTTIPYWTIPSEGWVEGASIAVLGPTHYLVTSASAVWYTEDTGAHWTLVVAQIAQSAYSGTAHPLSDGTLAIPVGEGPAFESAPAPGHTPPYAIYQAPTLPAPQPRLPFLSGLSPAVTELVSPQLSYLIDDGTTIYAAGKDGWWTAPLSNHNNWVKMPGASCSGTVCRNATVMAYDAHNHIVYSANWGAGFWRLVTR